MSAATFDEATCTPNISSVGRRVRRGIGYALVAVSAGLIVAFAAFHVVWYARLFVFLPAMVGAICFLQVRRNTCVKHARAGTRELPDSLQEVAVTDAAELRASRAVAATIQRDGSLIGAAVAVLAALTALVA